MTFMESIRICFTKYVVWKGRAARSEYWWFVLFAFAASIVLGVVDAAFLGVGPGGTGILGGVFSLATFLPSLSVLVRRLHDTDRTGWWFWVILVPVVGWIVLVVFLASKSSNGDNQYGAEPFGDDSTSASSIPPVSRD